MQYDDTPVYSTCVSIKIYLEYMGFNGFPSRVLHRLFIFILGKTCVVYKINSNSKIAIAIANDWGRNSIKFLSILHLPDQNNQ